jgi:hypothetical protein
MSQSSALVDRLRQPEHTGENRCRPCTVVNVAIAAAISGVLALLAVEVGVVAFVVSVLVIYLRGYLVPYTPTLTTKYLPEPGLRALGKEPEHADRTWRAIEKLEQEREQDIVVDQFLIDIEAIERSDPGSNGLQLTEGFKEHVDAYVAETADEPVTVERIAALFDADPSEVSKKDREYPAYEVGFRIRKWPSEAALDVDIAADTALEESTERWREVPIEQRREMLRLLRTCRRDCPVCGGDLAKTSETVKSCCVNVERYAFRCEDCGVHLREHGDPTELSGKGLTGS